MIKLKQMEPECKMHLGGTITEVAIECVVYDTATGQIYTAYVAKGKAICNPTDKQDVELGRKIAEARAHFKAFKKARQYANTVLTELRKTASFYVDMLDFFYKTDYQAERESEYVNKIIPGSK